MEKHWVEEIFKRCGAIRIGHFVLNSWKHTGLYLDKTMIYPDGEEISDICFQMASEIEKVFPNTKYGHTSEGRIEVVAGPAEGGIVLAHEVAKSLSEIYQEKVLSIFTEKEKDSEGKQVLKRPGFQKLVIGKNVLVVDDILTTGKSVRQVMEEVIKAGGLVIAVIVICNRGGVTSKNINGYPIFSLWEIEIESWEDGKCPLCNDKIPINEEVGRGKEYLAFNASHYKEE